MRTLILAFLLALSFQPVFASSCLESFGAPHELQLADLPIHESANFQVGKLRLEEDVWVRIDYVSDIETAETYLEFEFIYGDGTMVGLPYRVGVIQVSFFNGFGFQEVRQDLTFDCSNPGPSFFPGAPFRTRLILPRDLRAEFFYLPKIQIFSEIEGSL